MADADDLARIEAKIKELADANLALGRPYLLSKLGVDLHDDLRTIKEVTGKPLAHFINERLHGMYSIIFTGTHRNIQAIIAGDQSDVSKIQFADKPASVAGGPRYNYRFWAAFSVPRGVERRFLNLIDFRFQDVGESPGIDYIEVEPEFIVDEDAADRDEEIRENIKKWLEKAGMPAGRFIATPPARADRDSTSGGTRSVLEAVINALDRRQLANTNLSLDVVADLLRKRFPS